MTMMPSATGVRVAGDDYQWLAAWRACLRARYEATSGRSSNTIIAIGVEAAGVGNADDVVAYRRSPPHTYTQVKYATDASTPLNLAYLTEGQILLRLVNTHKTLTADGNSSEILLLTNRQIDPSDVLLKDRDGRDGRLVPRALQGGARSARGLARAEWARVADIDLPGLVAFFEDFVIESGRDAPLLRSEVALLMTANGLRADDSAVEAGINWVRASVVAGKRRLDLDDIDAAIGVLDLAAMSRWSTVSIAVVDHDPLAQDADFALDCVDQMDGAASWSRIAPRAPFSWGALGHQLSGISATVAPGRVLVTGHMRQAVGFLVGTELRGVRGYVASIRQRDQLWRSDAPTYPISLNVREEAIGGGGDLAIVVQIAYPGADDALDWIRRNGVPASSALIVETDLIGPAAVSSPIEANSIAVGIRNIVRSRIGDAPRIHLFQIGPLGVSVLLGHHWSRLRPTVVYEHVQGAEYVEAFQVNA